MLYPKFIIEDDRLIISKVTYHKDMVTNVEKVRGGGWFRYNADTKTFIFHGDSHDFGKAKMEDVARCVADDKVFTNRYSPRSIATDYKFAYDIGSEIIPIPLP